MPHERAVMSQSTEHDDAIDPPSQLADYYQWVEPDRGIRVYINFETAERLQLQVLCGLDANAGTEVGGILLGRTELDEGRITAVIDDFDPVPCSYSNGPLYSATGADAAKFEAALTRHKSGTSSGLSVVGYYRSHKRNDLYLSADDLTLIQRVFPGPDNVFLLIKPLSIRACTGGFFFWENGVIQSEFTLEVPFAPVRPPSPQLPETDDIDDLLLPSRLDLDDDLRGLSRVPGLPRHDRWHGRARDLGAGGLGIVLSLGAFGYWQATRSSVVIHAPVPQKITVRVQPAPAPPETRSREVEKAPAPTPTSKTQQIPAARIPRPQASHPVVSEIADNFHPAQTTVVTDPKLELAVPSMAVTPPPALQNLTPPEIAPPRMEPAIPAPPSAAVPNAEPVPQPSTTSFVGPQIISRVNPAVPLDVRSLIAGETQIDVTVIIDTAGKVTSAQVTSSKGAAARLVAAEAIKAARLFRFQPARENDRAVQSRMVLTFRFRRTGE